MVICNPKSAWIPSLKRLWHEAFGDDYEFVNAFFKTAFSKKRCLCASDGKSVLAVLYWFDCECRGEKTAYIYAVATKSEYRGRGICRKLMSETHRRLRENGYKCICLVPGSDSLFEFYGRLGYKTFGYVNERVYLPSGEKTYVKRIGKRQYKMARRELLEGNAVIQEKENIDFLSYMSEFYKGDGFVLALARGGQAFVTEFLGDERQIPHVLEMLGCEDTVVRTPGKDKAFAMYYPLFGDVVPAYLGLAFD